MCVLLLGSTSAFPARAYQAGATTKASTEDDRIVDQIRLRLAGDADVKGGNLEVTSKDGAVVIKGRVESEKGKNKAAKLAKKVKGVKSVDNQLTIDPLA
jgi:osmotically-inducible protein OsmY